MKPSLSHGSDPTKITPGGEGRKSQRSIGLQDHEAGFWTKLIFRRATRRYGHVPLATRIRAFDAKLLEICERMNAYNAGAGVASAKLKELVQLKVAAMVGCPF